MSMTRNLTVGDTVIKYDFTRRSGMKNIRLRIAGDGTLCVSAPKTTPISEVERVIAKNADWIKSVTAKTSENKPDNGLRLYMSGEKFLYLGKEYSLVVVHSLSEGVTIQGDNLVVNVKGIFDYSRKQRILDRWYRAQAQQILTKRFYEQVEKFRSLFPDEYIVKIRTMTSRWGSCMISKNTVTLNTKLIYVDTDLIDFVILHELSHFKFKHHDKDFYALLSSLCPEHRACRKSLSNRYIYYSH